MKRFHIVIAILFGLLLGKGVLEAADTKLSALPSGSAIANADLSYWAQSGASVKQTASAIATYLFGKISSDCTATSTGSFTCTKTNGTSFAASATTDATNASNISAGTLSNSRLSGSGATTVDGVSCTLGATCAVASYGLVIPAYTSGTWYTPYTGALNAAGAPLATTSIYCYYGYVGAAVTIKSLGAAVTTTSNGNHFALALYSGGVGTLTFVDSTASIALTASTGFYSGSVGNTTDNLSAGGIWSCVAADNTTVVFDSINASNSLLQSILGSTTGLSATGATSITGRVWTGQTYGTWPPTLAFSSGADLTVRQTAVTAFQVN